MSSPLLTIVIPTRNRRASVCRLLDALIRQTLSPLLFEVVVCDDGSSDGTAEGVAAMSLPYALRTLSQAPRGRAAACNAGIRISRGNVILLLDDDMEPATECLAAHLHAHESAERAAVLGSVPVVFTDASPPVVQLIGRKFAKHLQALARPGYVIGFRDFYSGNCSIRRSVLMDVGLFDEDFTMYGNEDGELAIRLMSAGVAFVFNTDAAASQHYEKDLARLAQDNIEKGRTAVLLAGKHPEAFSRLALATYDSGSRTWRLFRGLLLRATRLMPLTPRIVVWVVTAFETVNFPLPARGYERALEYFYWVGVLDMRRRVLPQPSPPARR
jgi:GT2 family glycosyltransferase